MPFGVMMRSRKATSRGCSLSIVRCCEHEPYAKPLLVSSTRTGQDRNNNDSQFRSRSGISQPFFVSLGNNPKWDRSAYKTPSPAPPKSRRFPQSYATKREKGSREISILCREPLLALTQAQCCIHNIMMPVPPVNDLERKMVPFPPIIPSVMKRFRRIDRILPK